MGKIIAAGLLTSICVFFLASILSGPLGGEVGFIGIALLCGIVVSCTYAIITRLDALLDKNKEETKENDNEH